MSTTALGVRTASRGFAAGVVGAVFVCALSSSALARPGEDAAAKAIVDDAVVQYNLGHFLESSALFEKAYQVEPVPTLLVKKVQFFRRLGMTGLWFLYCRKSVKATTLTAWDRPLVTR